MHIEPSVLGLEDLAAVSGKQLAAGVLLAAGAKLIAFAKDVEGVPDGDETDDDVSSVEMVETRRIGSASTNFITVSQVGSATQWRG